MGDAGFCEKSAFSGDSLIFQERYCDKSRYCFPERRRLTVDVRRLQVPPRYVRFRSGGDATSFFLHLQGEEFRRLLDE